MHVQASQNNREFDAVVSFCRFSLQDKGFFVFCAVRRRFFEPPTAKVLVRKLMPKQKRQRLQTLTMATGWQELS